MLFVMFFLVFWKISNLHKAFGASFLHWVDFKKITYRLLSWYLTSVVVESSKWSYFLNPPLEQFPRSHFNNNFMSRNWKIPWKNFFSGVSSTSSTQFILAAARKMREIHRPTRPAQRLFTLENRLRLTSRICRWSAQGWGFGKLPLSCGTMGWNLFCSRSI